MARLKGASFQMGSDDFYPEERPARCATVAPFRISPTTVTNQEFGDFAADAGYVTTAEIPLEPDENSGLPDDYYAAGSLVFRRTPGPVNLRDFRNWWQFVPGANWKQPEGPGSSIQNRLDHPVVHVSLPDALAYAEWAGLALPTEIEWEYAARDGAETDFPWGNDLSPNGELRANTWHGKFPYQNDNFSSGPLTMPSRSNPVSRYGLYNMIGNVWEWTTDLFATSTGGNANCCSGKEKNTSKRYVVKGGSYLCAPNYCQRYRPAARSPQEATSSASHLGFRCVLRDTQKL